jgi:hypothetical protein
MVHIRGARALLVIPIGIPVPDYLGKAVWRTCSLGGFAFLAVPAWNGETSMRKIMLTVACATLLVTPAVALAAPIAGPLPIAKVSGEIITINHLREARRGKQVRTRPRWMDSYASDPAASRLSPGFVAPGDPGDPAWHSDFDRAVQANQYNGG